MTDEGIILLVTRDAGLRSAIAAALGIAGVSIITVDDCSRPRMTAHLRRAGLLIVDDDLSHADRGAWLAELRQCAPPARLVVLTSEPSDDWANDDVALVPKVQAAPAILKLLRG
jgi:DNA-binding response OmpR family regulator